MMDEPEGMIYKFGKISYASISPCCTFVHKLVLHAYFHKDYCLQIQDMI